ncbi:MAG: alanine--tRNA ligase [Propionibacteriaceae bacterium]
MKTAEIRRRYLDYFANQGHAIVPSASLVHNDPNLLFVIAGMVPFVPYFEGKEPAPWQRAVSAQKCIRTLDIDEVGKTTRHGTFFQMLGNFSFGEYFKKEAIEFAWQFVTGSQDDDCLGFDPDTVWVTVLGPGYHPDYPDGDVEARNYWLACGVSPEHIQGRSLKDNYWSMGVPGPGGPCSEIYIDRGPQYGRDGGPEADEDRFLEIWNLVFQAEELSAVRAKDDFDIKCPLKSQNIDTGAGLERIAYLMQGKNNLYEIDEVYPVIERAAQLAGKIYGNDETDDVRLRVVGDHVRSALMLMTDGVRPGNEARGYVLRRLLRRSIRAMRLLGVHDAVLVNLLSVSRDQMHISYPEIDEQWERVALLARNEEEAFRRTLNSGTQLFESAAQIIHAQKGSVLSGDEAFKLHDTYGFPIDLTLEMAAEQGLSVDAERFRALMSEQKQRAKADSRAKKGAAASKEAYEELRAHGESAFIGYTELTAESRVVGMIKDGQLTDRAQIGDEVEIVLEQTPFYAESGGQDADAGVMTGDGIHLDVVDVQRPVKGLIVHKVVVGDGELVTGNLLTARVDQAARFSGSQAHTATHIVHAVLRQMLGATATQAGSYNKPGYLRFDFSCGQALSAAMKTELEDRANQAVRDDLAVVATEMSLDQAKAMGAMAMFGEKYGDVVRMVEMGGPFSRELCGGTHVKVSSQIGMINLLGESSVGSGVRRVEALVSADAFKQFATERALVATLTDSLKVRPEQLTDRVAQLVAQLKTAEKTIADLTLQQVLVRANNILDEAIDIAGTTVVAAQVPGVTAGDLRTLATDLRARLGARSGVIALIGGSDKPAVVVATTQEARDHDLQAGSLIARACEVLGGRGGGKADLAQGGGLDMNKIPEALTAVRTAVAEVLN